MTALFVDRGTEEFSPDPISPPGPSPDFVRILQEMLAAGMVGAILASRRTYRDWYEGLEGKEAEDVAQVFSDLEPLQAIEAEHGFGAALNLEHRLVGKLIEWNQLGSVRHENALAFSTLGDAH